MANDIFGAVWLRENLQHKRATQGVMTSTQRPDNSLNSSSAASDELTNDIKATKEELQAVKRKIGIIEGGGDGLAKEHGYSTRITALESLRAEKVELDKRLTTYEIRFTALTQQQQQSGAGTSMLPVRQELVMFPCQSSCCIHQQTLQLSERVLAACAFDLLPVIAAVV
jgi:hypothetical protein